MQDLIKRIAERGERILLAINGLPLCGKTTVADGIASVVGGERITTSDALRKLNNPTVNYKVDNGILVEDSIVFEAIAKELATKTNPLVIVDGCFRREGQTRSIIGIAHDIGFVRIIAMEVEVSYPTIRKRFNERRRVDDTMSKIAHRIGEYKENKDGVTWALHRLARFQVSVDGNLSKDGVLNEALHVFGRCLGDILEPECVFKKTTGLDYFKHYE